jgi:Cdc6-like AAA superfamily ATPase
MDPISAIGLVASIVQLADASFKIVKFLDTIKDGGKERRQLCNEITLLWMTLRNLETHFAPLSEELNGGWMKPMDDLAAKNGVFEQLSETLDDVWNKLTTTDSLRSKVKQTLRWPFDKDYVDRTVGRIERLKTSIIIVEGQASIALAQEMKDDLTVVKQSVVISEFKEIIDWLSPLNFREKQGNITSAPGTGSWFFNSDEFQSWRTGDDRWLWCYGIPGAGKTFIASNTVNELRRNHGSDQALILVAFCSYDTPDTQSIDNLLLSLLKQVVQLRQSLPGNLQRLFKEHSALGTRPKMEEFVKILGDAVAESPKTYIIIDALDEILDDRKRVDLLEALFELKGKPKIMVTSRKIESVANRFGYPLDGIYCDGCQKKRLEVYYHCEDCADYDYCEDCRKDKDAGSHVFVRRFSSVRMRIAAQREDIESYVTRRIEVEEELRQMTERNPKLFTLIINTIVENAQDMYVHL